MLFCPFGLEQLAKASTQYSQLGVSSWGAAGDVFSYCYDENGSQTYKFYADVDVENYSPQDIITDNPTVAYDHYIYNLQNRLARVEKYDDTHTLIDATEYKYNDNGIRVVKIEDADGSAVTTTYLIDMYNHTGYAQTLEEVRDGVLKTYTIADDMLSEAIDSGTAKHLLYDGHGSTRQLVSGSVGSTNIIDDFSYDGYGVLLQDENTFQPVAQGGLGVTPGVTQQQATNLLYAGEQFDTDLQQYYLRARYYDQNNGRFNRTDPFSGSPHDPQSLHKYTYVHCNPINSIDPSGMMEYAISLNIGMAIGVLIMGIIAIDMIGYLQGRASITGAYMETMQLALDYAVDGLTGIAAAIRSHSKAVQKAIEKAIDAAKSAGRKAKKLLKLKKFIFFKFMMPNIFDFNMRALSTNPTWFVLNYLADPIKSRANRRFVAARYGHLRRPGRGSIDEFPYASTFEGGLGALGEAVPIHENFIQGGCLGAFYRWSLKTTPQPFLVVPIPI